MSHNQQEVNAPQQEYLFEKKPMFSLPVHKPNKSRRTKHRGFINLKKFVIKRIGKANDFYEIKEIIGQGGFGQVFKAVHKPTGTTRAIKQVTKDMLNTEQIHNLKQEFNFIRKLDHPHIVRIFEIIESDENICLATQYYEGQTINQRLQQNGPFTEVQAANIIRQLLLALNYCHLNKVVHRDIKGDNCIFMNQSSDHLILIDFGNSANLIDGKMLDKLTGTIHYIAPEVFDGKYDQKVDIWSVGVLLFKMITGCFPFSGTTMNQVACNIFNLNYEFNPLIWSRLSKEAKDLISSIFVSDPKQRPSAHQLLNGPWIQKFYVNNDNTNQLSSLLGQLNYDQPHQSNLRAVSSGLLYQSGLLNEEATTASQFFNKIDRDSNGVISREEIKLHMTLENQENGVDEDVSELLDRVGIQRQKHLTFSEFITVICGQSWQFNDENIDAIFGMLDTDVKGILYKKDFYVKLGSRIGRQIYKSLTQNLEVPVNGITPDLFRKLIKELCD